MFKRTSRGSTSSQPCWAHSPSLRATKTMNVGFEQSNVVVTSRRKSRPSQPPCRHRHHRHWARAWKRGSGHRRNINKLASTRLIGSTSDHRILRVVSPRERPFDLIVCIVTVNSRHSLALNLSLRLGLPEQSPSVSLALPWSKTIDSFSYV